MLLLLGAVRSLRNRNFVAIDSNGNTLSKTKNGVTTEFLYDIRNQLGEVRQDANVLGRYGYDSEGLRILKIGDDGRRQYTYDQLSVITEADQANLAVSKYDYGLDQLVRLDTASEGRSFFHLDILGSTVSLTQPAGTTRQSILYDAWGNERDRVGVSANNFTFTGHEKDAETALIYAKARFYDPDLGRFTTQDSFLGDVRNAPSLHRYYYANQNPLMFTDPTGNVSIRDVLRVTNLAGLFATAGEAIQEFSNTENLGLNFALNFSGGVLKAPESIASGLVGLVTPGGLDEIVRERPAEGGSIREAQRAAIAEAANPQTGALRAAVNTFSAVVVQPAVVVQEGLVDPILNAGKNSENVGTEISHALDSEGVDRAVHIASATQEFASAFTALLGPVVAGRAALRSPRVPTPSSAPSPPVPKEKLFPNLVDSEIDAAFAKARGGVPLGNPPSPRTAAGRFQISETGPDTFRVRGGGEQLDIDGIRGFDIAEVKHVANPGKSPFIPGSSAPSFIRKKVLREVFDEFRRAKAIIEDATTPFQGLQIITNDANAGAVFDRIRKALSVPGTTIVK